MTADVIPLATAAAKMQIARQHHPSAGTFQARLSLSDTERAEALVKVIRDRDRIVHDLTSGAGRLDVSLAAEVLQVMAHALVHPAAHPSLVMTWQQVVEAVDRVTAVMDSDMEPLDLGCMTYADAIAKAEAQLQGLLYPLIHGLPLADACGDCIRCCQGGAGDWQTRMGCTNHGGR